MQSIARGAVTTIIVAQLSPSIMIVWYAWLDKVNLRNVTYIIPLRAVN